MENDATTNRETQQITGNVNVFRVLTLFSILQLVGTWNATNYSVFLNAWTRTFQTDQKHLMLIFSLETLTFALSCPLAAPLAQRIGYRRTILLSQLLLVVGYAGAALVNFNSVWPFVLWLGLPVAAGGALLTVATAGQSAAFLVVEHRRIWSVMLTVAPTLGAALRLPLLRALLDRFGPLRSLLVWACALLCSTVAVAFMKEPSPVTEQTTDAASMPKPLWNRTCFLIFLVGIALMESCNMALVLSPKYAQSELAMNGTLSAWVASLGFAVSLFALLLLLLGAQRFVHTDGVMLSALLLTALSALSIALTSHQALFIALLSAFAASFSVARALFPAALSERLRDDSALVAHAYGVAYSTSALASACYGVAAGVLIDASGSARTFYVLSAVAVIGAACAFAASLWCVRRRSRRESRSESVVVLGSLLHGSEVQ